MLDFKNNHKLKRIIKLSHNMTAFRLATTTMLVTIFVMNLFVGFLTAQEFTQGYSTTENLIRGSVVGVTTEQENQVESITSDQNEDLLGIVVRPNDTAVTLTEDTTGVFVATTGRYEVLVANIKGNLATGDVISTSPISGVAQRSGDTEKFVLGKILDPVDFSDQSRILTQTTVKDKDGNEIQVKIARTLAQIDVGPNPDLRSETSAPEFLVNFSETIAGKPVSALRIYAGLIIVIIAGAISGSLLYSAIKTSIISIGRNPLSKNSVLTGLAQVVVISVIIFISGLIAVYLLLKI